MSADTAHWIELTEFAHYEPSALAFRALVALLDTWPADEQAAAIEYADKFLSKLPNAVRLAPWSWCTAASKGAVPPTWPLVRALKLTADHLTKGTVNLARLAHYASLRPHATPAKPRSQRPATQSLLLERWPATPSGYRGGGMDQQCQCRTTESAPVGQLPSYRRGVDCHLPVVATADP